jgi:hypothetical protein
MAEALGVWVDDIIMVRSLPFKIIGIIDDSMLNAIKDLNGESILPLDVTQPGWSVHLLARGTVLIPYDTLLSLGGWVMTISIKPVSPEFTVDLAKTFFESFPGLIVFVGDDNNTLMYSRKYMISTLGLEVQIPPLIITSLIIFNLMLTRVEERRNEIKIYSVLGLPPLHVGLYFLSEAMTLGIVGGILGYLTGIVTAGVARLPLNYSSTWVLVSVLVLMGVCLASTIYPLILVPKLVAPSLRRKWEVLPPIGDRWSIPLPFVIEEEKEITGIMAYIWELLRGHEMEDSPVFRSIKYNFHDTVKDNYRIRSIIMQIVHAPYELNVSSDAQLHCIQDLTTQRCRWELILYRLSGDRRLWQTHGYAFIDLIRKQFLMWRGLGLEMRENYVKRFEDEIIRSESKHGG